MYISAEKLNILATIFRNLAIISDQQQIRNSIGEDLLRLLDADYYASYVWDSNLNRFTGREFINMSSDNLHKYEEYYQFCDPITHKLHSLQKTSNVSAVIDRSTLESSEFFNDFLLRDGLCWGINSFAVAEGQSLGDLRIWRSKHRHDFEPCDVALVDLVRPAFTAALRRCKSTAQPPRLVNAQGNAIHLTRRELEIASRVSEGLHDKEIARLLGISLPTLRTHISHIFEKFDAKDRLDLMTKWRRFMPLT